MAQSAPVIFGPNGKPLPRTAHNRLVPAATQNADRKSVPMLDYDFHRNVSALGRRTLLSVARHLLFAFGPVRVAIRENAEYAGSSFLAEYRGENMDWKKVAEKKLHLHDRFCDVAGHPYNARTYRRNLLTKILTDGDVGTVYVKRPEDGMPFLQVIPGHRIASGLSEKTVQNGPYDGALIIDGVILDPANPVRPIAYRVLTGEPTDYTNFVDISVRHMTLHFIPIVDGQLRGLSEIGLGAWDAQDLSEARRWELLAQKRAAGLIFQQFTENGEPTPGSDHITAPSSGETTAGTPTGLWFETIDGGVDVHFKAMRGEHLEAVKFDRPSANQQNFNASVLREMLAGMGCSYDFTIDPTKIGGHSGRVLLEKINRNLLAYQDLALEPAARRFDGFRVGCFMERGVLPEQDDWYELEYQGPRQWSGDKKYDIEVAEREIKNGLTTRSSECRKRNESEEDVDEIAFRDLDKFYTRAKALAAKHGRTVEEIITMLRPPTPNGLPAAPQAAPEDPEEKE